MDRSRHHETDFYIRKTDDFINGPWIIIFKHPTKREFTQEDYDWYIQVALEKADKVKVDRHLLTGELLLGYRQAIREGYQHQLDPALRNRYDHPRNQNTIKGIQGYIDRMLNR